MHQHGHLDETAIPGTVHLVDLEGTIAAKHASGAERDVVLVPAPSADPDDPLNWSPRRKLLSTLSLSMYTLMVGIASAAIYSVLEPISSDTGLTLSDLNAGTGYMFLAFGWGCLFWQPVALQYGKRPVYLFSMIATLVRFISGGANGKHINLIATRQLCCGYLMQLQTGNGSEARSFKVLLALPSSLFVRSRSLIFILHMKEAPILAFTLSCWLAQISLLRY